MISNNQTQTIKFSLITSVNLTNIAGTSTMNGILDLDDTLSSITVNLGEIFRFYRYKSVHLTIPPFRNEMFLTGDVYNMACTYVPADGNTNLPLNMAEIEGTNVSIFSSSVLDFQHFHVGKSTLQSQNYKWWTTNGVTPSTDEDAQGRIVFVTNGSFGGIAAFRVEMKVDVVLEFKTLLDPLLL
jgi:hypothetical protein